MSWLVLLLLLTGAAVIDAVVVGVVVLNVCAGVSAVITVMVVAVRVVAFETVWCEQQVCLNSSCHSTCRRAERLEAQDTCEPRYVGVGQTRVLAMRAVQARRPVSPASTQGVLVRA